MEVLQIDHTPVDVIAVDQWKRLPIGGPWLTLAIDFQLAIAVAVAVLGLN